MAARICEHCGATVDDDARVMCPSCRRRLPSVVEAQAAPEPPQEPAPPNPYDPEGTGQPYAGTAYGSPYGQPPTPRPDQPSPYGGVPTGTHGLGTPYPPAPPGQHLMAPGRPPLPQLYVERTAMVRTSRATVAFRLVLAIPHFVVLYALSIAAEVVAIVAWFAALFTGAVPPGIYGFLGWVVTYGTRVSAYLGLLTDRWPVFGGNDPYPVSVWLPGPSRLNRAAVFFRLVLLVPVMFMAAISLAGFAVVAPVLWVIVLVVGRVPRPMFNAVAAVMRYQMRYYAYAALLTAAYPAGLFGDPSDRRENDYADDLPTEAVEAGRPPVLHTSARRLVTLFVVLGCLGYAGLLVSGWDSAQQAIAAAEASDRLHEAYDGLTTTDLGTCVGETPELDCVQTAAGVDAAAFTQFNSQLDDIDFPDHVVPQLAEVENDTQVLIDDFTALSHATSMAAVHAFLQDHDLDQATRNLAASVRLLGTELDDLASSDN